MQNVITQLKQRGFIDGMTSDDLIQIANKPLTVYVGFDPTSDSLHLGNLLGIMALAWFHRAGHTPIAVVGGATGMIGDPSGKNAERNLLDHATIEKNLQGIKRTLETILKTDVKILNNYDWFKDFGYIDFLREIGKFFRVTTMLGKESVKTRIASEEGMSYTEFSYQLLQGYDFLHLFEKYQVTVQMGGSDQWGNITAGTELVRKMRGASVYGLTWPLLTRSDGKKFGKTEEGTIWLNPDKLPPYDFYQYLFRLPDADVPKMLRMLTFLDPKEIEELEFSMKKSGYIPNTIQKRLAEEVTRIVHGEKGVEEALRVTEVAKPGSKTHLDRPTLLTLAKELPSKNIPKEDVVGARLIDLFVHAGLAESKSEVKRLILGGGVYLNNEKVTDENRLIQSNDLIDGIFLLLSVGKKKKMVIQVDA